MIFTYILCFFAGVISWAVIPALDKTEQRFAESRERRAELMKPRFKGKIPQGAFLVHSQDVDMGDIMSGKAGEKELIFYTFREALTSAHDQCVDEVEVSILDDSAELIVFGSSEGFVLRVPRAWMAES